MRFKEKIKYFIRGMGSVLEIFPRQEELGELFSYYNSKTPLEKDAQALASDWNKVGKDLENSIEKFAGI